MRYPEVKFVQKKCTRRNVTVCVPVKDPRMAMDTAVTVTSASLIKDKTITGRTELTILKRSSTASSKCVKLYRLAVGC